MTLVDDDALAGALRRSVDSIDLPGHGPDLAEIRRRGVGRRRRHRTAAAAAGLGVALAAGGAVAVAVDGSPSDSLIGHADGTRRPLDRPAGDIDASQVTAVIDRALDRAGITRHGGESAQAVQDGGTGPDTHWIRAWTTGTDPATAVQVAVRPDGGLPERLYPCQAARYEFRSCTDDVDGNGVRVVSGMSLSTTPTAGRVMWTPTALAIHPDGRQIEITAALVSDSSQPEPTQLVVIDYPDPRALDRMRSFVADPTLADVPPVAG